MIEALLSSGATITAFDPEAMENSKTILGNRVQFADNQYEALTGADALLIATEWNEFRTPDFEKIGSLLNQKTIFDGRNLFDLESMEKTGFHYVSIGRRTILPNT
jgi:UDPglucose 6-dehydrogenase